MRPVNQRSDTLNKAMKVAKRIAITILCCIPVIIVFAYLTRDVITSNFWQIFIYIVFMGLVVLIEEIVARKRENRRKAEIEMGTKKDVFK